MIRKKSLLITCLLSALCMPAMAELTAGSSQIQQVEAEQPFMAFKALQEQLNGINDNQQSLVWARKVVSQINKIKESAIEIAKAKDSSVTFLSFVDFLCHHCQDDLKKLATSDLKKNDFGYMVYSVPIFQGDVASQYGMILNQLHKENPEALLEILKSLGGIDRSKEALLEKVESLSVKLNTTDFSDISVYKERETMLETLGLGYVPVTFALINDGERPMIVLPVKVNDMEQVDALAKELATLSADKKAVLRKNLGQ
ncbi:MAG: hypothetical protein Q8K36_01315 [Alphaproteobacteria bacterium]|nr:hypothetical protein [Alphaproteobacteria bacterium]